MRNRNLRGLALAVMAGATLSAASVASAQSSLSTIYVGTNGGASLWTVYFDITIVNPMDITAFDVNSVTAAGTPFTLDVYMTAAGGTYFGNTSNPAAWTLRGSGSGVAAGTDLHSACNTSDFTVAPGTYGMAIRYTGIAPRYTNGTGANQSYSNSDMSLALGAAQATTAGPFNGGTPFDPRVWNGTIYYTLANVSGACCLPNGSCLANAPISSCISQGGIFQGAGSACGTCPQPGACCLQDGSCTFVPEPQCLQTAGASFNGVGITCAAANCPQPGACCFTDGQCVIRSAGQCATMGGTYAGNGVTCAAAACVQPGACCFTDGSCVIVTSARCTSGSGVYRGNGSGCATANCWTAPVLWNTAKVITNPGAGAGGADASAIPAGAATIGENENLTAGVRVADDFTVPAGENWTINRFITYGYQTGSPTTSTFTSVVVRIWDRNPSDPAAVSLFGDITTNRINLGTTTFSNIYRVTTVLTDIQRPIIKIVGDLPNVPLGPGRYYVEWSTTGTGASGPFIPLQTIGGPSFLPTGNALIWRNAPWVPVVDAGTNTVQYPGGQPVDLPFILEGQRVIGGGCYANCDGSTTLPCLNVLDFGCFLNAFAAGNSYANCDNSTTPPVLNVLDFGCFLNAFAAGCSNC